MEAANKYRDRFVAAGVDAPVWGDLDRGQRPGFSPSPLRQWRTPSSAAQCGQGWGSLNKRLSAHSKGRWLGFPPVAPRPLQLRGWTRSVFASSSCAASGVLPCSVCDIRGAATPRVFAGELCCVHLHLGPGPRSLAWRAPCFEVLRSIPWWCWTALSWTALPLDRREFRSFSSLLFGSLLVGIVAVVHAWPWTTRNARLGFLGHSRKILGPPPFGPPTLRVPPLFWVKVPTLGPPSPLPPPPPLPPPSLIFPTVSETENPLLLNFLMVWILTILETFFSKKNVRPPGGKLGARLTGLHTDVPRRFPDGSPGGPLRFCSFFQ